jgi:sugar diacid utilization regulator
MTHSKAQRPPDGFWHWPPAGRALVRHEILCTVQHLATPLALNDAGRPEVASNVLAVAVVAEKSKLAGRLERLLTVEARALDEQALVQREANTATALLSLARPLIQAERLELAERLRGGLAEQTEGVVSAGVGSLLDVRSTHQLGRVCGLARAALSAGRRVLGPGHTTDLRSLGARAMLALLPNAPELELFCQDLLEPLLDYDRRRRGRLLPTLEAYFAARQQPAGAAERLHEHRNTITYRLALVERLTGRSLRDPDDTLCFMLSLRVHAQTDTTLLGEARQARASGQPRD